MAKASNWQKKLPFAAFDNLSLCRVILLWVCCAVAPWCTCTHTITQVMKCTCSFCWSAASGDEWRCAAVHIGWQWRRGLQAGRHESKQYQKWKKIHSVCWSDLKDMRNAFLARNTWRKRYLCWFTRRPHGTAQVAALIYFCSVIIV